MQTEELFLLVHLVRLFFYPCARLTIFNYAHRAFSRRYLNYSM